MLELFIYTTIGAFLLFFIAILVACIASKGVRDDVKEFLINVFGCIILFSIIAIILYFAYLLGKFMFPLFLNFVGVKFPL